MLDNNLLKTAQNSFFLGDYNKAIEYANIILSQEAENLTAICLKLRSQFQLTSENDNIRRQVFNLVERYSESSDVHELSGYINLQLKKYVECEAELDQALNIDPKNVIAYISRGLLHKETNNITKALNDFGNALDIDPQNGIAYTYRGLLYVALGKIEKIVFNLQRKIDPSTVDSYGYIKEKDNKENFAEKALYDFNQAIELMPENSTNYFERGRLFLIFGSYPESLRDLTTAIDFQPKNVMAYYFRGKVFGFLGEDKLADTDYKKMREILFGAEADEVLAKFKEVMLAEDSGQSDTEIPRHDDHIEGMKSYNTRLPTGSRSISGDLYRGKEAYKMGDLNGALHYFDNVISKDHHCGEAFYQRASVYWSKKDSVKALMDITTAITLSQTNYEYYFLRGAILTYENRLNDALADLDAAIKIDPNNKTAYLKRRAIKLKMGLTQSADDDLFISNKLTGKRG